MTTKWYESRTNQAAMIGGLFLLASTSVAAYLGSRRATQPLPTLEIKALEGGRDKVLATLALRPDRQLLDSAAFAALEPSYLLLSDTFGIAIQKPTGYQWTAGRLESPGSVSLEEMPIIGAIAEETRKAWGIDSTYDLSYFGVRLDKPARVRVSNRSRLDSIPLGDNPFRNAQLLSRFEKYVFADDVTAGVVDRMRFRREIQDWSDSLIHARLPTTVDLYSGVFIAPITESRLPPFAPIPWHYLEPFDKVLVALAPIIPPPRLFYTDRQAGIAALNETATLANVELNGVMVPSLVVNRIAYVVRVESVVYAVLLQYVSQNDDAAVPELERLFQSVRLRAR